MLGGAGGAAGRGEHQPCSAPACFWEPLALLPAHPSLGTFLGTFHLLHLPWPCTGFEQTPCQALGGHFFS